MLCAKRKTKSCAHFTRSPLPCSTMKRKLKDLDMPMQRFCECETENRNIAYCTGGCLQCPVKDCAYYIVNFSNSVIEMHT